MKNFNDAFDVLMGHEGGYVNNPADPGGETMWGITKRVARLNGYTGPMKDLPQTEAKRIAKKCYWDAWNCDAYDIRVAWQIFDCAYNGGKIVEWCQLSAGCPKTGKYDAATKLAISKADPQQFIMKFLAYRLIYMTSIKPWPTFSKGWARRIAENLKLGAS
jgi:lysozyme family protein